MTANAGSRPQLTSAARMGGAGRVRGAVAHIRGVYAGMGARLSGLATRGQLGVGHEREIGRKTGART